MSVLGAYSKTDPDIDDGDDTADPPADASKVKLSLGGDDAAEFKLTDDDSRRC